MRLTLVETDLGAALQIGIQDPVDHKQLALDAADLPQSPRELVLPRIGGELAQNLAGRDAPGPDGGGDAQDVVGHYLNESQSSWPRGPEAAYMSARKNKT